LGANGGCKGQGTSTRSRARGREKVSAQFIEIKAVFFVDMAHPENEF